MLTRIHRATARGLDSERGFTLVELLVVVIIIGILAAIAIPVYLGVQDNSKDAGVKSDVMNAKIAVMAYRSDNPAAGSNPAINSDAAILALIKYGATKSKGTTGLDYSGSAVFPQFCITGVGATGHAFWVTDATGIVQSASAPAGC